MALKYRPEIDGLRAVAVLPVMLFHAGIPGFHGGFIGVDVFFVISGFLITSIILREQRAGRFSLLRFYERRARRILPALFAVLLATLLPAWLLLFPDQLAAFGASLWSVMVFGSNLHFWSEYGYFGAANELKPLLHTWSLAVEEQFYLLHPLLLGLLVRRSKRIAPALVVLALVSFGAGLVVVRGDASLAFYGIHTRAWQLMVGALCAIAPVRAFSASTVLGLGGIALSVVLFDAQTPWPGFAALLPTMSTALICWGSAPGQPGFGLLSHRALVGIGLISYSAYLWHQPMLAFGRAYSVGEPSRSLMAVLLLASLGAAWLSWRYVERPFRTAGAVSNRSLVAMSAGGAALFLGLGLWGQQSRGWPERLPATVRGLLDQAQQRNPLRQGCHLDADRQAEPVAPSWSRCGLVALGPGTVPTARALLIGDSHADALAPALMERARALNLDLAQLSASSCPPVPGIRASRADAAGRCPAFNERLFTWLEGNSELKTVVMVARWTLYLEGKRFDNHRGGRELGPDYAFEATEPGGEGRAAVAAAYAAAVSRLRRAGKRVVLILPVPEAGWDVPKAAAKLALRSQDLGQLDNPRALVTARNARARAAFASLPPGPDLIVVDPQRALCTAEVCAVSADGRSQYYDDDHPSLVGAQRIAALWTRAP